LSETPYNRPLHALALLTTAATFPLIFMGGLVTTHGAGMAVPDWPNSYGYNMVLFPPSQWVGGIWYEHVHRLYATGVGFLAVLLALFAWAPAAVPPRRRWLGWLTLACAVLTAAGAAVLVRTGITSDFGRHFQHVVVAFGSLMLVLGGAWLARTREPRRWVRWLCAGVLGAVVVQGVLGGLRVVMVELDLAIIHGCFAQAFFCLAALAAIVTSRWWLDVPAGAGVLAAGAPDGRTVVRLAAVVLAVTYLQLIAGALMRHHGAGLAVPDLPLHYGQWLPPTDGASLAAANAHRAWDLHLEPVTLAQVWLHMAHRVGAVLVTLAVVGIVVHVVRHLRGPVPVWMLVALLVVQAGVPIAAGLAYVFGAGSGDEWGAAVLPTVMAVGLTTLAVWVSRRLRAVAPLAAPAVTLLALLLTQVTLGVLTVLLRKPADVASAHVAVGALTLLTAFVMLVRSLRLYGYGRRWPATDPAMADVTGRSGPARRPAGAGWAPAVG
jgi:cytochrome c oxidase assembly protein subunit 15